MLTRWEAVQQGLAAHRRGEYFASIATLLPQVEGIINATLTFLGVIVREGGKFYKKQPDGSKGKELTGLTSKKRILDRHARLDTDLAGFLVTYFVPNRNSILHGADTGYGEAERSVHILLVLLSMAVTAAKLEGADNGA